jgi:hypothetical protein
MRQLFFYTAFILFAFSYSIRAYPDSVSDASITAIQAYEERLIAEPGWKWLSFPRLERYKDQPFDAITLLERIEPWPPSSLEMIYEFPDGLDQNITFHFSSGWNTSGGLIEAQSTKGYKLKYEKPVPKYTLRYEGAKLDYNTQFDLQTGDNWVGYYIDQTMEVEECLPPSIWNDLEQIRTQFWSMTKIGDPNKWFIYGKKAPLKYGDMVILSLGAPFTGFQWQWQGEAAEDNEIAEAAYFEWEEKSDYTPFYIETDSTSTTEEIAVLADGVVMGAGVREPGDTLIEVRGYLEGVSAGAVIEFQTWDGYKSRPVKKGGYAVYDHTRNTLQKRNIYAGENKMYYHVSLKEGITYELTPDIGSVTCSPNPFSNMITFSFVLNTENYVSLEVFDINGSLVRTIAGGKYPAGYYNFEWDGSNEAGKRANTGVYFYHATTGSGAVHSGKIVMIK